MVGEETSPPSSGVMKPKPLESLNHLTVPVAMFMLPCLMLRGESAPRTGMTIKGGTEHHFGTACAAGRDCALHSLKITATAL